jgi:hypothetical protein
MKTHFGSLLLSLVLLISLSPVSAKCSTNCVQHFSVCGKARGEHGLLLIENYISGECEQHVLYLMVLGLERPIVGRAWSDTGWSAESRKALAEMGSEQMIVLTDSGGRFYLSDSIWVSPPPPDTTFPRKFRAMSNVGAGYPEYWYRHCKEDCSDYPVFTGTDAELVYVCKDGLYKNYSFSGGAYFPESGYLVLIVNQPELANGPDTMHGFLVYRINR